MRRPVALIVVALVALPILVTAATAQRVNYLNGVPYRFPASYGVGLLSVADQATGALEWIGGPELTDWPAGLVVASPTGACPTGWTEFTGLRGRYPVGLVAGGTNGATVGTALTDQENRPVGQHSHSVTDAGHNHTQAGHTHGVSDGGHSHTTWGGVPHLLRSEFTTTSITPVGGGTASSSSTTGVAIDNATGVNTAAVTGLVVNDTGTVAGTNAPYVQLTFCETPEEE